MSDPMSIHLIPPHMREQIICYLLRGVPMGGFLTAVFSNNLFDAVGAADSVNIKILPAYAIFICNNTPPGSWGSRRDVVSWSAAGGCPLESLRLPAEWAESVAAVVALFNEEANQ